MTYSQFLIDKRFKVTNVIYRFKNLVNGKVYIGQTSKPLRTRVIQHMTSSQPYTKAHKTYFLLALNKYGFENFEVSIIERCRSQSELDERERYWIAYYNSTDKKYGYNIDSGGTKGKKVKSLTEVHKKKLLLAHLGKKQKDITKQKIGEANKIIWKDPQYRKKNIHNIMSVAGINRKTIYQYDLNGLFIRSWKSGIEVSQFLYNKPKSPIYRNIKLNMKKGKLGFKKNGFIWSYYSPKERRAY